jgi:hypothetical protein
VGLVLLLGCGFFIKLRIVESCVRSKVFDRYLRTFIILFGTFSQRRTGISMTVQFSLESLTQSS